MGKKDNCNEQKPIMNSEEYESVSEAALRELHDIAEALMKALGKRRNPNSIRNYMRGYSLYLFILISL